MPTGRCSAMMIGLLILFLTPMACAQGAVRPSRTDMPPIVDGTLDDAVWQNATLVTGFKTWLPDFGQDLPGRTDVRLAYDADNLYFAFHCLDNEPDQIKSSVTARDRIQSDDWVCLHLDTFNDQQSLYAFYVNPQGIQMDARAANGDVEDYGLDLVWYSAGAIDDQGYSIEMQIPLKSIRFHAGEPVEMGFLFERNVSRRSEKGTFPHLNPDREPTFFTQTQTLLYTDLEQKSLLEILPAITYGRNSSRESGRLVSQPDQTNFSCTGKIGLTSDLVLDGVYNPDFSQVEADVGQVDFNQRYALFYDEKRPFFLEGKELFNFGGSVMSDPLQAVVHTRTIVDPVAGIKLTGKLGQQNTIASLFALDDLPDDSPQGDYAAVAVIRYMRTLDNDGFIGAFGTARELDNSYNRVVGADGQIRLSGPSRIGFHGFYSGSRQGKGVTEKGHAAGVNYSYSDRAWRIDGRLRDLSADFNTETGFLTRTNLTSYSVAVRRFLHPGSSTVLRVDPLVVGRFQHDKGCNLWEQYTAAYLGSVFPRNTYFRGGVAYRTEVFQARRFSTNFVRLNLSSQLMRQLYFSGDYRFGNKIRYLDDPYPGTGHSVNTGLVYQPTDKLNSSLDFTYTNFRRKSDGEEEFSYIILRFKNTYQLDRYTFFRAILEYNRFAAELTTDFLASFTYVPGTVIQIGYGNKYSRTQWESDRYVDSDRFLTSKRGFFCKASYLLRM